MKKYLFIMLFVFALTGLSAQQSRQGDEIIVYRLPDPSRVYIYNDGSVVYEAAIPGSSIINNTFILPDNVRLESLTITQDNKRIYSYTTFIADALVVMQSGEMPRQVRVAQVYIPELKPGSPLDIKYGIRDSGLSWKIYLDMEVVDGSNLNCALIAELRAAGNMPEITKHILARNPEIILASASNALLDDSSASFNLGKITIEANKRLLLKLEEGRTPYKVVYYWDANRRERPSAYMRSPTPLKTMAGQIQYNLNSGGITIDSGYMFASPDRPFDIHIGEQPNIVTFKSSVTAEFPERKSHPFTHSLEYRIENQSNRAIDIEISVPLTTGINSRTEYKFTTRAPDERPGDRMLWKYNIPAGKDAILKFTFDTDVKNDPSYRQFDYYGGDK